MLHQSCLLVNSAKTIGIPTSELKVRNQTLLRIVKILTFTDNYAPIVVPSVSTEASSSSSERTPIEFASQI